MIIKAVVNFKVTESIIGKIEIRNVRYKEVLKGFVPLNLVINLNKARPEIATIGDRGNL